MDEVHHRKEAPEWHGKAWLAASLLAIVFVIVGVPIALFVWGIPWLSGQVASTVPVEWEQALGRQAFDTLAPSSQRCRPSPELGSLTRKLISSEPESPYTMEVLLVSTPLVNAFAVPGGGVIVHRGLLDKMRSPDELAAVLAHEFQHVLRRHSTRAIFRGLAWSTLAWFVIGDASGLLAAATESLGALKYQRSDEEEADLRGAEMLRRSGIDPRSMVSMLEELQQQEEIPAFLSSHPATADRLRNLGEQIPVTQVSYRPSLSPAQWHSVLAACSFGGQ